MTLYNDLDLEPTTDNIGVLGETHLNMNSTLESLDQIYMDNLESLQSVKDRLDSISTQIHSVCPSLRSGSEHLCEESEELEMWMSELKRGENIWTVRSTEREEREELDLETREHIAGLARNVVSGCGGGTYDMWADHTSPPPGSVVSCRKSKSYWSDYSQMTRRELLVSKIREVVLRTFREAREKVKCDKMVHSEQESDSPLIQCPKLMGQPVQSNPSPSRSRILELLVKANPITEICELEKLADRLFPIKTSTTSSTASPKPKRHNRHLKEEKSILSPPLIFDDYKSKGESSVNPFEKPPHLIKEFVPKIKKVQFDGVDSITDYDLKPIELLNSNGPKFSTPAYLLYQFNYKGEPYKMEDCELSPAVWGEGYKLYPTQDHTGFIQEPSGQPSNYAYLDQTMAPGVLPFLGFGGSAPVIPPIPEELQRTTPPNLPTVMMLSQLFTSNGLSLDGSSIH